MINSLKQCPALTLGLNTLSLPDMDCILVFCLNFDMLKPLYACLYHQLDELPEWSKGTALSTVATASRVRIPHSSSRDETFPFQGHGNHCHVSNGFFCYKPWTRNVADFPRASARQWI